MRGLLCESPCQEKGRTVTRKLRLPEHEIANRRRGNTTHGTGRKGFKGGRARLYPEGTELYHVALKLADPECRMAIWLGRGNMSDGIRRALETAYKASPPSGLEPLNRFEMEARVKKEKAERKHRLLLAKLGAFTPEEEKEQDADDAGCVPHPDANTWDDTP
jgi:hypothetical protein